MPHIVVEYSENLEGLSVASLLTDLHQSLAAEESVDIKRLKTRAVPLKNFVVGDKGGAAMIHIALKLMPRPPEVAKRMALALQEIARRHVTARPDCAVTVEVVELNPATYCA